MKGAPCKDCQDRVVGCHSNCECYTAWKKKHDEEHELIIQKRKTEGDLLHRRNEAIRKFKHAKNNS